VPVLHRTRSILTRQRTQIGNAIRAHLGEFGIVAPDQRRAAGVNVRLRPMVGRAPIDWKR